jgi:hypothetical protein
LPPSAGFAFGDAIKSFSFGRNGTGNPYDPHWCEYNTNPGSLYFSVSCSSTGATCTDVAINAATRGAAADIYASGAPAFGAYTNPPAFGARFNDNLLATDAGQLGLAPGDNLTGLQFKVFNGSPNDTNRDFVYLTMTGPSFSNDSASIYIFDAANPTFNQAAMARFAAAADLGLRNDDAIDALVLSDITPGTCPRRPNRFLNPGTNGAVEFDEVLFSLALGSPTLTLSNLSAADVFYSKFDGTFSVFAGYSSLGLLPGDDVDALGVQPGMPMNLSTRVEPANKTNYLQQGAVFTAIPYGLPKYSFQWYSNGLPIFAATNAVYTNPPSTSTGIVVFTVVVTNLYSKTTNNAVLTVQNPPVAGYSVFFPANQFVAFANHFGARLISSLIPNPPGNTVLYKYNGGFSAFAYDDVDLTWTPTAPIINQGEGAFLKSPVSFNNNFTGTVVNPNLPININSGANYLLCDQTIEVGSWQTIVGTAPVQGSTVKVYTNTVDPTDLPHYTTFIFSNSAWFPSVPSIPIGRSAFFQINTNIPTTFTITASGDTNVSISPSNTIAVASGQNVSFSATPAPNYDVAVWLVDNALAQVGGTNFVLMNVAANHNIQVNARKLAQPVLNISYDGSAIHICWPASSSYVLQYTPSLSPPIVWTPDQTQTTVVGDMRCVDISPLIGTRFFRLALGP